MSVITTPQEKLKERGFDPEQVCEHYSDLSLKIRKVGTNEIYVSALDTKPCKFQYVETDIPIETPIENEMGES